MGLARNIHNLLHPKLGKILMLHRVVDQRRSQPVAPHLEVTVDFFTQSLDALLEQRVDFIAIDQVVERLKQKNHNPFVCLTFDDGYLDTYTKAYPILKERQIPFCVYMTRDFYRGDAKPHWSPDAEMMGVDHLLALGADPLCTIGVHTCSHPHLSKLPEEEQRREIEDCKTDLEQLLRRPIRHLAYPHGYYNKETLQIVRQLGFATAVTTSGRNVRNDTQILELDRITFSEE